MNWVCFDGEIVEEGAVSFSVGNRAFHYGDSLFETMVAYRACVLRYELHWARLAKGMEVLDYHAPWSKEVFRKQIKALLQKQGLDQQYARVRCQFWRKSGGLYTPQSEKIHWLIQATPYTPQAPKQLQAGIAKTITLAVTPPLSSLKTGSALPYVLAGLERKKQGWDEIILLNSKQQIAEAGASNLFWVNGSAVYTPSLASGCLAGVTRQFLINYCNSQGIKLQEGLYSLAELYGASHIFTSNVAGLHHIVSIDEHTFAPWPVVETLQQSLLQP